MYVLPMTLTTECRIANDHLDDDDDNATAIHYYCCYYK